MADRTYSDEEILDALMSYNSIAEAARSLDCDRATLYRRMASEDFIITWEKVLNAQPLRVAGRMIKLQDRAIEIYDRATDPHCPADKKPTRDDRQTANQLLKHSARYIDQNVITAQWERYHNASS